jgi:hypothetical protein
MRSTWLALALVAAGCFSESPSAGGCVDGEAACDCRPDATCDAGLECIASIDKCTPVGCTPGSESCTCVDGDCLTGLVCDGGVCIPPSAATTGGDVSMSGTTSPDTVADTTLGSSTTPVTMTDPATTDPTDASDPTIPPDDTSASDVTESMSGTVSTDPTDASDPTLSDASDSVSFSDTVMEVCPACIDSAAFGVCQEAYDDCQTDAAPGGCNELRACIVGFQDTVDACCAVTQTEDAHALWAALVDCAQTDTCTMDCQPYCPG